MKPPFKPTPTLSRLDTLTALSSAAIMRLEADVQWYKAAMFEKGLWARDLKMQLLGEKRRVFWCAVTIGLLVLALAACATALALRSK